MVAYYSAVAALASTFVSQSLAAAIGQPLQEVPGQLVARDTQVNITGPGLPASNPPGVICYNTWETITNPPIVQYWYVTVPNAENSIKADRVWNHLNLNGCAPTENKYHGEPDINGCALTFHTSSACTAARVSHALRSGSEPGINIACEFTSAKEYTVSPLDGLLTALDGTVSGILTALDPSTD